MRCCIYYRIFGFFLFFLWSGSIAVNGATDSSRGNSVFRTQVVPYLEKYCYPCHGPLKQKGGLRFDTLGDQMSDTDHSSVWVEIRNQINLGEMPPEEEPQPPIDKTESVTKWISSQLRLTQKNQFYREGRSVLRRLSRDEYTNTISDLFHMKFPTGESPKDLLPPDGTFEGFDKTSASLLLDPSLMELYFQVAKKVADKAIVDGPPEFPTEKMRLEFEDIEQSNAIGYLISRLGMNPVDGGIELVEGNTRSYGMLRYPGRKDNNVAPVNGFYRFTVRAAGAKSENGELPVMLVTHSHPDESMERIMEFVIDNAWDSPKEYSAIVPRDTLGGEIQVQLVNETKLYMSQRPGEDFFRKNRELGKDNQFAETIKLAGRKIAEGWGGERSTPDPTKLDTSKYPRLYLDYIEVEGPIYDQWPPQSHSSILFKGDEAIEDLKYARQIFERFLPRAWRRPTSPDEIQSLLSLVEQELSHGKSFRDAIKAGIAASLISPNFLLISEPASDDLRKELSPHELASRLSYFLWSSMPDDHLFSLAASGEILNKNVLQTEIKRMLGDNKINRFVQSFAGQWLKTDTFLSFTPDKYIYKTYDASLGQSAVSEAKEYFRIVLDEDLSILNFIDSDFVMINGRLAQHYGIKGITSKEFKKVSLSKESPRGGILGMMGVHMAGADGIRTKPVSRAVYIKDVLFNDPPDPPPPNAGEIEPNIKGEKLTVRERLIQHQQIETCAACHRKLDPYGLALENFNAIGQWREFQDGENFRGSHTPKIDVSGKLPNGHKFSSFKEFKKHLLKSPNRFRKAMIEKIFLYAIGRPVEPLDSVWVDEVANDLPQKGDSLSAIIESIILSPQFMNK